jgi:RNA processing factor Prp31
MSERNFDLGPTPSEYVLGAMFDLLDELITRNRAYERVLETLVQRDDLQKRIKQVESLRPSAAEPPIYTDLRARAIAAAQDGSISELLSLVRQISDRTHLWMNKR